MLLSRLRALSSRRPLPELRRLPLHTTRFTNVLRAHSSANVYLARRHLSSHSGRALLDRQLLHGDTRKHYPPKYKVPELERILDDRDLEDECFYKLSSGDKKDQEEITSFQILFANAVEMCTGPRSAEAYSLVLKLWEAVFETDDKDLQEVLFKSRAKVTHLMINNLDFASHEKLMGPLNTKTEEQEWATVLATTLQFSRDNNHYLNYNRMAISGFIRNRNIDLKERKLLLATFLRKALLYSNHSDNFFSSALYFLGLLPHLSHGDLLLVDKESAVFEKALRLLAIPPQNKDIISHVEEVCTMALRTNPEADHDDAMTSNWITTLINCTVPVSPKVALEYWRYKVEVLAPVVPDALKPLDLHNAMTALFEEKQYEEVLKLYAQYPSLQNDDQIEILLNISERTKDWKLLQTQFESMYGRGELPHVVHYSVVMNALASIGSYKEVEQLYEQLLKRKLEPTAAIYTALIRCKMLLDDPEGAKAWYQMFMKRVQEDKINVSEVARMNARIFGVHFQSSNMKTTMKAFHDLLEQQNESKTRLIDARLMCDMVTFSASAFALRELEELMILAEELNLTTEAYYARAISALTKFGKHEQAEEMAFQAHLESVVPFASALIYKAQAQNLRVWFKSTADRSVRQFIASRLTTIITRVDKSAISVRDLDELLVVVIKHFVSMNKINAARSYLNRMQHTGDIRESHFLPFLQHYVRLGTYEGHLQVLDTYREMAACKINITSRTYVFLIKSLIYIDKANHTNFDNSYRLMESVFQLHGLSILEHQKPSRTVDVDLANHAANLLKIVSSYVVATALPENSMLMVTHFLNQMKERLGKKITFEFRLSILYEMSKLYYMQGDMPTARRLVDNAFAELHDIVDHNLQTSDIVPKLLQLDYRRLVDIRLRILYATPNPISGYLELASSSMDRNIQLSGSQYSEICMEMLKHQPSTITLHLVLRICDTYLVGGNWVEVKIMRKIQYIYKLIVVYLSRTIPRNIVESKYGIFNNYYNIRDVEAVKKEFAHVKNPLEAIDGALSEFSTMLPESWGADRLLHNLPDFFVPERRIPTRNIISPLLASVIFKAVEKHCGGDQTKAFELYTEFPEVMEYLLYFGEARTRLMQFRVTIDRMAPPSRSGVREDFEARRLRSIEALEHLKIEEEEEESDAGWRQPRSGSYRWTRAHLRY